MNLEEMLIKTDKREAAFRIMINHLKTIDEPLIIETGCARPPHSQWGTEDISFKDEGFSTRLFDAYIQEYDGEFYSVDITPEHVDYARSVVSENTQVICSDSVEFLWQANQQLTEQNQYVDLLYLDSYDFDETTDDKFLSPAHHLKELAAIMGRLRPGSLVAVDDNNGYKGNRTGKGMYVEEFMESLGKPLIHDGYQLVWKF
jgi:SAM-dependent methyltransferase